MKISHIRECHTCCIVRTVASSLEVVRPYYVVITTTPTFAYSQVQVPHKCCTAMYLPYNYRLLRAWCTLRGHRGDFSLRSMLWDFSEQWELTSVLAGAAIKFNNSLTVPDHGMIMVDDLPIGEELSCMAIGRCCSLFPRLPEGARLGISPSGIGSWLYPNGSYVLPTISDDSYGIVRHHGQVNLHRQSSRTAEGIWRCVVPGIHGGLDTVHIGIYSPGQGT